jgi:hypothetical protein
LRGGHVSTGAAKLAPKTAGVVGRRGGQPLS